jgi:hypothetical protein
MNLTTDNTDFLFEIPLVRAVRGFSLRFKIRNYSEHLISYSEIQVKLQNISRIFNHKGAEGE